MKENKELEVRTIRRLAALKDMLGRDPNAAIRGRARFLAQASAMRPRTAPARRVLPVRRVAWQFALASLLVLVLLFGGGAGAALAAQQTIPGETLYPVKLLSEDIRLGLTSSPQSEIDLLMEFVGIRVGEINRLAELQEVIPVSTTERLESHVELALQAAAGLGDDEIEAALTRIRTHLEAQTQTMAQVGGTAGETMAQVRTMFQAQIRLLDEGIGDPQTFRNQVHAGRGGGDGQPETSDPPAPGEGQGAENTPGGSGDGSPGPQVTPDHTPGPSSDTYPYGTPVGTGPGMGRGYGKMLP